MNDPIEQNTTSSLTSPGAELKRSREDAGMSYDDVYQRTRIAEAKLRLLEDDRFDAFDAQVFVAGYIRNFARAVGANGDALVAQYQAIMQVRQQKTLESEAAAGVESATVSPTPSSKRWLAFPIFIALLILVWLIWAWWLSGDTRPGDAPVSSTTTEQAEVSTTREQPAPEVLEVVDEVDEVPLIDERDTAAPETATLLEEGSAAEESNLLTEPPSDEALALSAELEVESESASLPGEALGEATEVPAEVPEDTIVAPTGTEVLLEIAFTDECWVEVKNAAGEKVFADLKNKGDNLRLFGEAPFEIFLGNARAAAVQVDGEPVDVPLRSNSDLSRFSAPRN